MESGHPSQMLDATPANLSLFRSDTAGVPQRLSTSWPFELHADSVATDIGITDGPCVAFIHPVGSCADAIGVLFVLPGIECVVALNGIPLAEGMHTLRHADRVDAGTQSYWVAARQQVEEATYDAAVHGEDVFCFLTKARLRQGQAIKICPGTHATRCGVIYKSEAWDLAMHTASFAKCPHCGYRPHEAEWQPSPRSPKPTDKKALHELLHVHKQSVS